MAKWRTTLRAMAQNKKAKRYGVGAAAAVAQKMSNTLTRTMTTNESNGGPITTQRDFKTDYRKRRMTKRRRVAFRRKRKWNARVLRTVREATVGSQHIVRRNVVYDLASGQSTSNVISFGMNSLNGTTTELDQCNDFGQVMFEAVQNPAWANWESGSLVSHDTKIHNMHSTMELTINNTGDTEAIVEVYYIRARKRIESVWANPSNIYRTGFLKQGRAQNEDTDDGAPNTIGTELADNDLGVTPFQCALFCRAFTIYKRQKYRIPAGDEVSFTMTDSRPSTYTMSNTKPYAMDHRYRGVLLQYFGPPEVGGTPTPAKTVSLTFQCTRRYRIKIHNDTQVRDGKN